MDHQLKIMARRNGAIVNIVNLVLFFYSLYKLYTLGFASEYKYYTYIPLLLSIISFVSLVIYGQNISRTDISYSNALSTFIGFIPFAVGCYITFFLGLFGIYQSITNFNIYTLLRSIIFIYAGYKLVYHLWIVTEIQKKYSESDIGEKR